MRWVCVTLMLAFTACAGSVDPPILEMSDSGSTIELAVGESFLVDLAGNPSTGFAWLIEDLDETMIVLKDQEFGEQANGAVGAGGRFVFEFEATGAGETDIELRYRRSWEEEPAERVFNLHVVIG